MLFPTEETVATLKKMYPVGCRVELLFMNDTQAPPVGTKGTVIGVDDIGSYGQLYVMKSILAV